MSYAYDPELAPLISLLPVFGPDDLQTLRAQSVTGSAGPPYEPPVPVDIQDRTIPGPADAPDVTVRVYTPSGQDGPRPGVLYIHGGGFVFGAPKTFDASTTRMAAEAGVVVVSVDYRLAPENPYPAGLDDCYAALLWVAKSATELGIAPDRLAVYGESAGAGLAAALTLLTRDRGGPSLCYQYLGIPELDDRLDTPSMRAYVDTPLWNRPMAEFSWESYLGPGRRGAADVPAYAAPARAEDLSGLPPATVVTCQYDPMRDEGIDYAQRLAQADVPVELRLYPGTFHGSVLAHDAAVSRRMIAEALASLKRGLGLS
ncbi:alpha/beta hydrolase [Streptomyces spinoverrucosus]|uniref:alpha/beta hydrolase n=1 Tax=Streptomyces spinoverrucosus TaxID=284043 RepID=UPI0018C35F19|nr:alpha/beta hydrolase [Streptomyces spinoverrucosus]MBG0855773.1 alpha/beta hydrolase [Streptomyces spinoverrucosus]